MPFRFRNAEVSGKEARRIVRLQLDLILAILDQDDLALEVKVHEVRKRCKRVRGFLRLCRPALGKAYQRENEALRDAARLISKNRDERVMLELCEDLVAHEIDLEKLELIDPVRISLVKANLIKGEKSKRLRKKLQEFRREIVLVRKRSKRWPIEDLALEDVCRGLEKTYLKAREQMKICQKEPTVENLHSWRKRVKYHRFHLELLDDLWKPLMRDLHQEAKVLCDELGDDHDLAVLLNYVKERRETFGEEVVDLLSKTVKRHRKQLRQSALKRGRTLLAAKSALRKEGVKDEFDEVLELGALQKEVG